MKRKKNVEDFTAEEINFIFEEVVDSSWTELDYLCAVAYVFGEIEKSKEEEEDKNIKNQELEIGFGGGALDLGGEREGSSSYARKIPLSFHIAIPKKGRSVVAREKGESSSINSSKRQRLMRDKSSPLKKTQVSNPPLFPAISDQELFFVNPITADDLDISKGEELATENTNPLILTAKEERLKKGKLLKRPIEEHHNHKKSSKRVSPKRARLSEKEVVGDEANNKNKKKKWIVVGPNPPPDLPTEFKNRVGDMGGTDLKLVIQKKLFWADINVSQNRLLMPLNQLMSDDFLSDEEKNVLNTREGKNGKNCKGIIAGLIDSSPNEFEIVFKKWNMRKSESYLFNKQWCYVVKNNGLEKEMIVQIWSFRVNGRLYFALVKLPPLQEEEEEEAQQKIPSVLPLHISPSSQSKPKQY